MIAGLFIGVWVARYLGPEKFGIFNYVIAFVSIFGSIAKLGLDSILVRDLIIEPSRKNDYLGTAFWLKVIGALIMIFAISVVMLVFNNDHLTTIYIYIVASGIIFQSFEVIDFYLQANVLSKFVSICKMSQLLISSILKIILILMNADLIWFVVAVLADQIILALTLYLVMWQQKNAHIYRNFKRDVAKKLLVDGFPLILSGLAVAIYMRIDQVMINTMLGSRESGLYSAAVKLTEVWYFVPVIVTTSLFPAIVNAKKICETLYLSRLQKLYDLMALVALSLSILITFTTHFFIDFIFGDAYVQAGNVLAVNIWAGLFVFMGVVSARFQLVEGFTKLTFYYTFFCSVINIILNLFLIPRYGIIGAASSTLITQAIGLLLNYSNKRMRVSFYMQIRALFMMNFFKGAYR